MELQEMSIKEFCDLLGSDAPTPGGGSAAALSGAQGAALSAMVCSLTLGKEKYMAYQGTAKRGLDCMRDLKTAFLSLMQTDADAFNDLRAALALPKATAAEVSARKEAVESATIACIRAPLTVMEHAVLGLELTQHLVGKTNQSAITDLAVAALSFRTALRGAWLNIKANLPGLTKTAMIANFRQQGEKLLLRGETLMGKILQAVEASLV